MSDSSDFVLGVLKSNESFSRKMHLTKTIHENPNASLELLERVVSQSLKPAIHGATELGDFGNVWIRLQRHDKEGVQTKGHKHYHDHQTLVINGGLTVYVDDEEPFDVWAASSKLDKPSFFTVPAGKNHYFIPLVDDTLAYCVFAVRDEHGELTNEYDSKNDHNYYPSDFKNEV